MSEEEVKTEVKTEVKPEEKVVEKEAGGGEPTEIEIIATKIGWNPGHEDGDREFLSAEDFILKSKEIQNTNSKQMKSQRRKIDDLTRGVADLKTFQETNYKVQVKNYKSKIKELRAQLKDAETDEDTAEAAKIKGEINEIQNIPDELPTTTTELPPEFVVWRDKNEWYENDDDMKDFADALGDSPEYRALATVDFKRCLKNITTAVKKEYPDKFEKPKKKAAVAASVEKGTRSGSGKSKFTYKDLTRGQQDIADNFAKLGIMTVDEYIKDLEKEQVLT